MDGSATTTPPNPPRSTTEHAAAEYFRALRSREFSRLARARQAYLDYTGSGLYGSSQLEWHRDWLSERSLGNPHSENPASLASTGRMTAWGQTKAH